MKSHSNRLLRRPQLECLEERCLLSAYTVKSATDDGSGADGTLSAAINSVNAGTNGVIAFHIGNAATATITVTGVLPALTKPVYIDGWSQANDAPGSVAVELSGPGGAGNAFDGLTLNTGGSQVMGLAIDNFNGNGIVINNLDGTDTVYNCNIGTDLTGTAAGKGNTGDGILIAGPSNYIGNQCFWNVLSGNGGNGIEFSGAKAMFNTVAGNYIGVDSSGNTALKNNSSGVKIGNGAGLNYIGDSVNGFGNTISGNGTYGVDLSASNNNQVVDNTIGLGNDGTTVVANGNSGVRLITSGAGNKIGLAYDGNVISGNTKYGIVLTGGANVSGNTVVGNLIGTDSSGTVKKANLVDGIFLNAPSNTIGGVNPGEANTISGNGGNGITITELNADTVSLNFIGTDKSGTASLGNGNDGVFITSGSSNNMIGVAGAKDAQNNRLVTVISGNGNAGVQMDGSNGNTVVNCFIGTDVTGMKLLDASQNAFGNTKYGVEIGGGATASNNNTIGGTAGVATQNVISGNGTTGSGSTDDGIGILSGSSNNNIWGNFIGTDSTGMGALGNGNDGISVGPDCTYNNIGGPQNGAGNLISANGRERGPNHPSIEGVGVSFTAVTANNNLVQNNIIGLNLASQDPNKNMGNPGGWQADSGNNVWKNNQHN